MTQTTIAGPNAQQIAYWNSPAVQNWVHLQDDIDAMMAPFTQALLGGVNLGPEGPWRILDVGCGSGETTLLAADIGHDLTGLDVSQPLLDLAKDRAARRGQSNISFFQGDAAGVYIDPPFDVVMSRFGVMFFEDPYKAFKNLARMIVEGGRLVFVCWRTPQENQWVSLPMQALGSLAGGEQGQSSDGPGPFAFADAEKVTAILRDGGFEKIAITPFDAPMTLARTGGVAGAAAFLAKIGPAARIIRELESDLQPVAQKRIETAITPYMQADTITLTGAIWIVEAVKGA